VSCGHFGLALPHFIYFATIIADYSILGFYPVEVMHLPNLGVAHWAAEMDVVHPEGKCKKVKDAVAICMAK